MNVIDSLSIGRPITRGPLTLYPLYVPSLRPGTPYTSGPVASTRGELIVDEADGGEVSSLEITNVGNSPVLLIEGQTFEGGKQNRVLNVSVLLGVGSTRVPVSCVEAHRWSEEGVMRLSDRRAPRRLRRAKNRSVQHSMRTDGSRHSDQGAVWSAVDATLIGRGVQSDTADLHSAFEALDALMLETDRSDDDAASAAAAAELARLGPLPGQTGVVVAAGGRCLAADLFDSPETLETLWRQIIASHAFDLPTETAKPPSIDRALRSVRRVLHAQHAQTAGVGMGTEHHWSSNRLVANGLEWNDSLLHLSIVAA